LDSIGCRRVVRYSISTLISTIGRIVLPRASGWKELFEYIFRLAGSADPNHRESALLTLEALEEHICDLLGQHFADFYELFKRSLQPTEAPIVQVASIKCVNMLLPWVVENEEYIARFRDFIPLIVGVVDRAIASDKEEDATAGFEVLAELAESPSAVLEPYIIQLTEFVLRVGQSRQVSLNIRIEAMTVIQWIAQFKPGLLVRHGLVRPTMEVAFSMASEPDEDDDVPHDELTARKFGAQVIDCLCKYVENHQVYPIYKEMIAKYLPSPDFNHRAAAASAMSVGCEGLCELMVPEVKGWVSYLTIAHNDPHIVVRQLACIMLGRFAEWLSPEIYEYYTDIMPLIAKALMEDVPNIQERACYALLSFVENLETEQSLPYMDDLMARLIQLIHTSNNRDVQEMCISAVSAVASSTGVSFTKYFEPIVGIMARLQSIVDEERMVLRSRAIECAGVVALAVGKDTFGMQNINAFMHAAVEGFNLPTAASGDMREYVMSFFANMAETLKGEYTPFLQGSMQLIGQVLLSTDGVSQPEDLPTALAALTDDFDDGEDYEEEQLPEDYDEEGVLDEEALEDDLSYSVGTSFLDEKIQALHALGVICVEVGPSVIPFIENMYKIVSVLKTYVHHDIRKACCFPLENMIIAVHRSYPPPAAWSDGMSPEMPLSPQARSFIDEVMAGMVKAMVEDIDRETVARCFDTVKTLSEVIGVNAVFPQMPTLGKILCDVFEGKLECQEVEEEDEENESIETEQLEVFIGACDILMCWAKKMDPQHFAPYWEIVERIVPFLNNRREGWRQEAAGALCEIVNAMKMAVAPRAPFLLEAIMQPLQDEHAPTRSNAAYLAGLLFDTRTCNQYATNCAQALVNVMVKDTDDQCLDNCCGAYGRIIFATEGQGDLSGLNAWMAKLPLRLDLDEWSPVLRGLFVLFQQSNPAVAPHIPQVVHIMTGLLTTQKALDKIEPELQQSMFALVKHLGTSFAAQLAPIVSQLSADQQQMYSKCVNS
jgi:importin-4